MSSNSTPSNTRTPGSAEPSQLSQVETIRNDENLVIDQSQPQSSASHTNIRNTADVVDSPKLIIPVWINGNEDTTGCAYDVVVQLDNPTRKEVCWKGADVTIDDANRAIDAAQAAFPSWSKVQPVEKRKILLNAADILESRTVEYGSFMMTELSSQEGYVTSWVIPTAVKYLRSIASHIPDTLVSVSASRDGGMGTMVCKEPYGVILGICCWSSPYIAGMRAIATTIATGNTTVIVCSKSTPRCYWALGKIFHEAGLPAGVLNIIPYEPSTIGHCIHNPAVRKVNFTANSPESRRLSILCGHKPYIRELDSDSCAIILSDADLDMAVSACLGTPLSKKLGQICISVDHVIISPNIANKFLGLLLKKLEDILSKHDFTEHLDSLFSGPLKQGRICRIPADKIQYPEGSFQTVLGGCIRVGPIVPGQIDQPKHSLVQQSYGPAAMYSIFKDEKAAIGLANFKPVISASVFTKDLEKGVNVAKKLECGMVHINTIPVLPMEDVKTSGWKRYDAATAMNEFLVSKTVTWNY